MELPIDFIQRTRTLLGNEYSAFEAALESSPPVSIRLNSQKGLVPPSDSIQIPWCQTGYYLPNRLTYTFDPHFHAGGYYVQEASSMFLEQAIKTYLSTPVKCLDLCAAPGGKSTHLLELLPEGSLLVSNEVIRNRAVILAENIAKWGAPNVMVSNNDPETIGHLTHYFDVIVADVPCSGEGMFRKDEESQKEWSMANVNLSAARQKRILNDIWSALKPGGLLIYSTCTYNTEENEDNIRYISEELGAEVLPLTIPDSWQINGPLKGNLPVYRFLPHKLKGEGFFLAVLRKAEGDAHPVRNKNKKEKENQKAIIPDSIRQWIVNPERFFFRNLAGSIEVVPSEYKDDYVLLTERLKRISAGIRVGESKGKDLVPQPALALSTLLNRQAFPTMDVDWSDAIRFLRKEALSPVVPSEKGYHVVVYKNLPLGFIKHLGNRTNNLYPAEWRIRTGYTPEEILTLE